MNNYFLKYKGHNAALTMQEVEPYWDENSINNVINDNKMYFFQDKMPIKPQMSSLVMVEN